jgi:hypothetical protein
MRGVGGGARYLLRNIIKRAGSQKRRQISVNPEF